MSAHILDQTDRDIISLLQHDAKLSSKEIASKLRKRPATIFARLNKLKTLGYLKGSITLIDREKVGMLMVVFINIQLNDHHDDALLEFQRNISSYSEVMECYHTTGQVDFILKVVVPDMSAYKDFLIQNLSKMQNVRAYASHFVISETKRELAYPLENLV